MKQSILAARRQTVIEKIAEHAERLGAGSVDLVSGIKGDADHKQLQMLERIEAMLAQAGGVSQEQETPVHDGQVYMSLDDILSIPGLTKTSEKAIREAFNVSSD